MSLRTIRKRRKECKTDYKSRMALIKSGIPRLVIRKTNKVIVIQEVESYQSQDSTKNLTTSQDLLKQGLDKKFSGSLKSIPAGYLTGLLMAKKLKGKEYIVDWGLSINKFGGRTSAAIKGIVDGGITVRVNEKIFPSEERISGKHLNEETKKAFDKLKEKLNGK